MSPTQLWPEIDVVVFTVHEQTLKVLLLKRRENTSAFPGAWALPGGSLKKHVEGADTLEDAVRAELRDKTGAEPPYLEQLCTFGGRERDPRGWTLSVAYFALVPFDRIHLKQEARWWPVHDSRVPTALAFDHETILATAITRLRSKLEYTAIAGHLLGEQFTIPQLKATYEIILGEPLAKTSFRRNLERAGVLEETGALADPNGHRPAALYRFTRDARSALFFPRSLLSGATNQMAAATPAGGDEPG